MLLILNLLLLVFTLIILSFFQNDQIKIRLVSVVSAGLSFIISSYLIFEGCFKVNWLTSVFGFTVLKLDGLSLLFYFLSTLLVLLCLIFIWEENKNLYKDYASNLLLIEFLLLVVFSSNHLLIFYIAFEAILIPMFLIIGIWGSRERKIRAVYLFFFYTLVGSILLLIAILYIFNTTGSLNIEYISQYTFSKTEEIWLWSAFFLSFASKIPLFPLHIWLPEAHVEAPTVGSVLLAGVLLKLGVYGFLRFSLVFFPKGSLFFAPLVVILAVLGVVYTSLAAVRQTDIKKIIAYSSVAHMNLVVLGIFSFNSLGIEGAILQSISHGFVAAGLFFLIGILYSRYHSRFLYYYSGLIHVMPVYGILLVTLTFSNIALPGTSSFVGEFLLLLGVYLENFVVAFVSALGIIFCGMYSLWVLNKLLFGNLKIEYSLVFKDITAREFLVVIPLVTFSLLVGIYPYIFSSFANAFSLGLLFINF